VFDVSSLLCNLIEVIIFVTIFPPFKIKVALQYHISKCLIKHSF